MQRSHITTTVTTGTLSDAYDQLKEALKKFPVDRREPYTNVQLKAGKDTPMGAITEIKQALREHYILKLNMETKE